MVNPTKVKEKLPNLLVDGCTSKPSNLMLFLKKEYRIKKYAQREPQKFSADLAQIVGSLEALNMNAETAFWEFKKKR